MAWPMIMIWNESHDLLFSKMIMNGMTMILHNLWLWYDFGMNYDMIMNGMTYNYDTVMNCWLLAMIWN